MARPAAIVKRAPLTVHLPMDVKAQLVLHLMSPALGAVPRDAYSQFLSKLIREHFEHKRFETPKGVVSGPEAAIDYVISCEQAANDPRDFPGVE